MKSKAIVLVSHCVINQNSVIEGWARARGAFPIVDILFSEGVGIVQLPCPELIFHGINRPPLEYEDYNTPEYRKLCGELLITYLPQIKTYIENGYKILGVIGINKSPSCSISGKRGVFMEELFSALESDGIKLPYVEIPEQYKEGLSDKDLEQQIIKMIRKC